ncbi:MAG: hypothetical protein ACXAD7_28100, partial [Candidatus Kariarchaeaceae archaeon]
MIAIAAAITITGTAELTRTLPKTVNITIASNTASAKLAVAGQIDLIANITMVSTTGTASLSGQWYNSANISAASTTSTAQLIKKVQP